MGLQRGERRGFVQSVSRVLAKTQIGDEVLVRKDGESLSAPDCIGPEEVPSINFAFEEISHDGRPASDFVVMVEDFG